MTRNIRFCNRDGVYIWFSVLTSIFADDRGRVVRILGKMMDIDESMREKEALRLRAQTDSMTGLYNKMATEELVTHALRKYKDSVCALLIVDMDNLKRINDTLGHTQGTGQSWDLRRPCTGPSGLPTLWAGLAGMNLWCFLSMCRAVSSLRLF